MNSSLAWHRNFRILRLWPLSAFSATTSAAHHSTWLKEGKTSKFGICCLCALRSYCYRCYYCYTIILPIAATMITSTYCNTAPPPIIPWSISGGISNWNCPQEGICEGSWSKAVSARCLLQVPIIEAAMPGNNAVAPTWHRNDRHDNRCSCLEAHVSPGLPLPHGLPCLS